MTDNCLLTNKNNRNNQCLILFVFDTSGSMFGDKIDSLNHTIESTLNNIEKLSESFVSLEIHVNVLGFAKSPKWVARSPLPPSEFKKVWQPLETDGETNLGLALAELNTKLKEKSNEGWLDDSKGFCLPIVVFLTDGVPGDDYLEGLTLLNNNESYRNALKFCFGINDDDDFEEEVVSICQQLIDSKNEFCLISQNEMCELPDYLKLTLTATLKTASLFTKIEKEVPEVIVDQGEPSIEEWFYSDDDIDIID